MARSTAVWGIDIGQCALKRFRCRPHDEDPAKITAEAFDYVEYPKILSQPDADPVELIREALEKFLSRNSVRGDRVAISVSGQSGLARFIKLPPVESKKIPDIVKYEARQQIPFALEDVVWDYQQMAGGSETDGFAIETEVGLFAMKRDQVQRALKPFDDAGIEVDILQLTPLAIYNYTVFDQMQSLAPPEDYDPDSPPESVVVLSLGTDTTDLVVTNGYRVWQRSVPLGGNHFTKALTKELRLTFAKAEHLKRNATQADDPKAVFQAMRPIFNDLLTEVQRSIGFFTGLDRKAKIGRVIALGNAMKLPGLQKFLSQNLGYPVTEVESYRGLTGAAVVNSPIYTENLLSFAVCYGLCLQALGKGTLATSLLPREIVTTRMIRAKQPWAVAAAALVLLGCAFSYAGYAMANRAAYDPGYKDAIAKVTEVSGRSTKYKTEFDEATKKFDDAKAQGDRIVGNVEGRRLWLELLTAINASLPRDPEGKPRPEHIEDRNELHIDRIEIEKMKDDDTWLQQVQSTLDAPTVDPNAPKDAPPADAPAPAAAPEGEPAPTADPAGETWIIEIIGHHFHNNRSRNPLEGAEYVNETFVKNLKEGSVTLETADGKPVETKIADLGVVFPVLTHYGRPEDELLETDEDADPLSGGNPNAPPAAGGKKQVNVKGFDFVIQFMWVQTPLSKRQQIVERRKKKEAEEAARQKAAKDAPPADGANNSENM